MLNMWPRNMHWLGREAKLKSHQAIRTLVFAVLSFEDCSSLKISERKRSLVWDFGSGTWSRGFILFPDFVVVEPDVRRGPEHLHFLLVEPAAEEGQQPQGQLPQTPRLRSALRRQPASHPRPTDRRQSGNGSDPEGVDPSDPERQAERFRRLRMSAQHSAKLKKYPGMMTTTLSFYYVKLNEYSTEVAFAHLIQLPKAQILMLPKFILQIFKLRGPRKILALILPKLFWSF